MENPAPSVDRILEVALLAAGQPLTLKALKQVVGDKVSNDELRRGLEILKESWRERGLSLIESAGGYQFVSRPEYLDYLHRLNPPRPPRLSRALLEVLSIIAYHQPVTRGDIEKIRGIAVSSSQFVFLEEMGWIEEVGQRETPGRPMLYATTKTFIDDLGLKSLDDLPPLTDIKTSDLSDGEPELPFTPNNDESEK